MAEGMLARAKNFFGFSQEDDYDYDDEYDESPPARGQVENEPRGGYVTPIRRSGLAPVPIHHDFTHISTIRPKTFNDISAVVEVFQSNTAVIMELSGVDSAADPRRIIDFASGLVAGLGGRINKVNRTTFLLSPRDMEVSFESAASDSGPVEAGLDMANYGS